MFRNLTLAYKLEREKLARRKENPHFSHMSIIHVGNSSSYSLITAELTVIKRLSPPRSTVLLTCDFYSNECLNDKCT